MKKQDSIKTFPDVKVQHLLLIPKSPLPEQPGMKEWYPAASVPGGCNTWNQGKRYR